MVILIMGPQGAGKTTQTELLAKHIGITSTSVGKVLRNLYEERDPLGIEAEKYWSKGELVPNKLISTILEYYLNTHTSIDGFVMDGFPRDIEQYQWMEAVFGRSVDAVVYIELDKDEIMKRLHLRRKTQNRRDETPEAINTRLREFNNKTLPLLDQFKKDGIPVIIINGHPSIHEIQIKIRQELGNLAIE